MTKLKNRRNQKTKTKTKKNKKTNKQQNKTKPKTKQNKTKEREAKWQRVRGGRRKAKKNQTQTRRTEMSGGCPRESRGLSFHSPLLPAKAQTTANVRSTLYRTKFTRQRTHRLILW